MYKTRKKINKNKKKINKNSKKVNRIKSQHKEMIKAQHLQ